MLGRKKIGERRRTPRTQYSAASTSTVTHKNNQLGSNLKIKLTNVLEHIKT